VYAPHWRIFRGEPVANGSPEVRLASVYAPEFQYIQQRIVSPQRRLIKRSTFPKDADDGRTDNRPRTRFRYLPIRQADVTTEVGPRAIRQWSRRGIYRVSWTVGLGRQRTYTRTRCATGGRRLWRVFEKSHRSSAKRIQRVQTTTTEPNGLTRLLFKDRKTTRQSYLFGHAIMADDK